MSTKPKPLSDEEYAGCFEALTKLDSAVSVVEAASRAATKPDKPFARGKLKAYTAARNAVARMVAREQERRALAAGGAQRHADAMSGVQTMVETCESGETRTARQEATE